MDVIFVHVLRARRSGVVILLDFVHKDEENRGAEFSARSDGSLINQLFFLSPDVLETYTKFDTLNCPGYTIVFIEQLVIRFCLVLLLCIDLHLINLVDFSWKWNVPNYIWTFSQYTISNLYLKCWNITCYLTNHPGKNFELPQTFYWQCLRINKY